MTMREIETGTLRQWLEDGRPVSVLDIRTPEDREQWSIPESLHVNAYERLKAGDADALADVVLPAGRPVVTVCNAGKVSQLAAEQLRQRGIDAYPLAGGMKSWSLSWNTAELPVGSATVVQVRRTGKGCLSYLIGSGTEAVVIDASLAPALYLRLAAERGWSIRYVLDTHIHADHLSRSRALAEAASAKLMLPAQERARFSFELMEDGQVIAFGDARLLAISTPGHTMESMCFKLNEEALFTGDSLFLTGVGRPDLNASMEEAGKRARILYRSLRRLCDFPATALVFPGHTAQPVAFDRRPLCRELGQVSASLASWLSNEEDFVRTILPRIPPTPPNFLRIVELNEAGILPEGDPTDLEAGANRCAIS
jgi:glyoxylase-like metal-dependent hydrolase (beta-lactamase superfamily II)/rhodanese-related sulfurtransferase